MSYPEDILWGVWTNEDIEFVPDYDKEPYAYVVARSISEAIQKYLDEYEKILIEGEYITMVKQISIGVAI